MSTSKNKSVGNVGENESGLHGQYLSLIHI